LRIAEFGFLGVLVFTCVHTPRLSGPVLRSYRRFMELNVHPSAQRTVGVTLAGLRPRPLRTN